MESETSKLISQTTDEDLIIIKSVVDYYIVHFDLNYSLESRSQTILDIFELVRKKYISTQSSKYYSNKQTTIDVLVKSYLLQKLA